MSKAVYVASSWRNSYQPRVVKLLREWGFKVYDFRNPPAPYRGFQWSEIDPNWQQWDIPKYWEALQHPIAKQAYKVDFEAMKSCDICVLVLPSGRSSHLEAGWFMGQGRPVAIVIPEVVEAELMYKMAFSVCKINELETVMASIELNYDSLINGKPKED